MTSDSDYETKAQLMLNKPQNYAIDEFVEVIVEVGLTDDDLAGELEDEFVRVLERRDKDPSEEYEVAV